MFASHRLLPVSFTIAVALLAGACSAAAGPPTTGPSAVPSAAFVAQATATLGPTPPATPSSPTAPPSVGPSPTPTPAPTFAYDAIALTAGRNAPQVMGTGSYPGYTVIVPAAGWFDVADRHFVIKYPTTTGPVLGLSVWDIGQVFRDPCHWQGQGFDPGPSVGALVAALVAQPMRNATRPTDVTLAGYKGRYLEVSVPADLKSSTPGEFDACDTDSGGYRDFQGWLGNGMGNRHEQVPGQVDRLWVLDVRGQRLVVDATYSPDTTPADRAALQQLVESLRFDAP